MIGADMIGTAAGGRGARGPFGSAALATIWMIAACAPQTVGPADGTDRAAEPRPNVIVILADDGGYADFGAFGEPEMPTPHIDSIAANGVRFTQGYNAASVCSPSRAGLLTGRYPQRFGHEFNIPRQPQPGGDMNEIGLPLEERTIADALRAEGYATAVVGKWHLGLAPAFHPLNRGFDRFFGFLYGSRSYFALEDAAERGVHLWNDEEPHPEVEGGYLTDVFAERSVEIIEASRDRPFFLYASFNAVHTPMHARPEDEARFPAVADERRRTLAAMTVALDDAVGRILDKLRELDLEDNTLLFFVNDNGGATNNASSNGPLRGQKGDKFEGGIRVPFIAQWPDRLPRGVDFDAPVTSMDIFPTAVAAAGGSPPEELDGVDLLPYLAGEVPGRPHRELFWRRGAVAAMRYVDDSSDLKLIRVDGESTWLFDMAADPYETTNLLAGGALGEDEPPTRAYLESALATWEEETVTARWRTDPIWRTRQIEKHTPGTAQPPVVGQQEGYTPTAAGAPSTDIYLADLTLSEGTYRVGLPRNVTDRDGYDNQPAFEPGEDGGVLYTSARNRQQTDIYRYDPLTGATRQVTRTTASEFSPTPLPDGSGFSAIRESAEGQLLWRYGTDGRSRSAILSEVQPVGYHAWGDADRLLMYVLGSAGEPARLVLASVRTATLRPILSNPGRSLHKVPGRAALSFVRKVADEGWWIEVLDVETGEATRFGPTLPEREDFAWTPDGAVIMGDDSKLYQMRPGGEWLEIADLEGAGVRGISRLAINEAGNRIALVGNR